MVVLLAYRVSLPVPPPTQQPFAPLQIGQSAKYSVNEVRQSNITGITEPPSYQDLENTESFEGEVTAISGTNVRVYLATGFKNGTWSVATLVGNLETGDGNLTLPVLPLASVPLIIKGNLKAGDPIPGLFENVSRTTSQIYTGHSRDINCYEGVIPGSNTATGHCYYDKSTGFLCEAEVNVSVSSMGQALSYSTSIRLNQTSMFANQVHKIVINNVTLSPAKVYLGARMNVTVLVDNYGNHVETFDVALYYNSTGAGQTNSTEIGRQRVTGLAIYGTKTLSFDWNVSGLSAGTYVVGVATYLQDYANIGKGSFSSEPMDIGEAPSENQQMVLYAAIGVGVALVAVIMLNLWKNRRNNAKTETQPAP